MSFRFGIAIADEVEDFPLNDAESLSAIRFARSFLEIMGHEATINIDPASPPEYGILIAVENSRAHFPRWNRRVRLLYTDPTKMRAYCHQFCRAENAKDFLMKQLAEDLKHLEQLVNRSIPIHITP